MPHLTLEYTDNLSFDVQPLLARLHEELVATGAVNLKGIKSRTIRHTEYRIAVVCQRDGHALKPRRPLRPQTALEPNLVGQRLV